MYQSQIAGLKLDIIRNGGFEGCQVSPTFKGIQIAGVRKVPESINQGRHCVFVDLEDFRGLDYWVETGNNKAYYFSKPLNEVAAHVDIYGDNNKITIMSGSTPEEYSQTISGLSANHTSYGHSSYLVYAVFTNSTDVSTSKPNEALQTIERIEDLLKHLKGLV